MKQVAGVWLPAWEAHLVPFLEDRRSWVDGRGTYQRHKLLRALPYARARRRAVDIGAHVGLWSMQLTYLFDSVLAFEPLAVHRCCYLRNVDMTRATLLPCALGAEPGGVSLRTTAQSSGDSWINGTGSVPLRRYDDLGFDGQPVDLVKVDCEGYELFALRGAEGMLTRDRPVVIVEQKPGKAQKFGLGETEAVSWLEALGARLRDKISGDYILSW